MSRYDATVFDLTTIADYLELCCQAVDEFAGDQANVLRGFSAILSLNHVPDWIQYKLSTEQRCKLGISGEIGTSVKEYFEAKNEELKLVRAIANGFKHLRIVNSTSQIGGYGQGPFGVGPFGAPYLLIDKGEEVESAKRWVAGLDLTRRVLEYWKTTLEPILSEFDYE